MKLYIVQIIGVLIGITILFLFLALHNAVFSTVDRINMWLSLAVVTAFTALVLIAMLWASGWTWHHVFKAIGL